jgi:hypothetical protein
LINFKGWCHLEKPKGRWEDNIKILFYFIAFFTIYSRYLKRVISKRDGWEYLKQVPSIDGFLELI